MDFETRKVGESQKACKWSPMPTTNIGIIISSGISINYLGKPPLVAGSARVDVRLAERVLDLVYFQASH